MARVALASLVLGGLLWVAGLNRAVIEAPMAGISFLGLGAKEVGVLALVLAAAAVYPVLVLVSGGLTLSEIRAMVRRRPGAPPAELL
jgi:putative peptidoglycan lipid II flippase